MSLVLYIHTFHMYLLWKRVCIWRLRWWFKRRWRWRLTRWWWTLLYLFFYSLQPLIHDIVAHNKRTSLLALELLLKKIKLLTSFFRFLFLFFLVTCRWISRIGSILSGFIHPLLLFAAIWRSDRKLIRFHSVRLIRHWWNVLVIERLSPLHHLIICLNALRLKLSSGWDASWASSLFASHHLFSSQSLQSFIQIFKLSILLVFHCCMPSGLLSSWRLWRILLPILLHLSLCL